jgi:hypothetical protein
MKKAIELSLNFLVTIIIALAIFGLGIKFISNLTSEATELESLTTDQLDKRTGQMLCESTGRVCIGISKKTIPKGKFDVFGIKIINILDDQDFGITIEKPSPSGYTKNNDPIETNNIKLKYRGNVFIEKNEEESIGIGIEVPKDAVSGTYIFNIKIMPYDELYKIYVEVP